MRVGIPRSVLLGRIPAPDEPLWLPADTDGLLALQSDEDARCPGCNQILEQSMDPDLSELWDTVHDPEPCCHACAAMDRRKRAMQTGEDPGRHRHDGVKVIPYMDDATEEV
jgi:hypothetical protein